MNNQDNWQQGLPLSDLQTQLDEGRGLSTRPYQGAWGYFLRMGPEMAYFSWFASLSAMLRYLVQVEILHAPTSLPDRPSYDDFVVELQAIAAAYEQNEDAQQACAAFNACFPDFALEWLGSYAELLKGETEFAQQLHQLFGASGEISADNQPAFADFLENHGI